MNPDQLSVITSPLSQSVLGIACLALVYAYLKLWAKYDAREKEHEIKLEAKEALIREQYEKRIANNAILIEALSASNRQQAFVQQQLSGKVPQ